MAKLAYRNEDWYGVLFLVDKILKIPNRTGSYICEADAWGALPCDIAAMSFFHIGNYPMALHMAKLALEKAPQDARIAKNVEIFGEIVRQHAEGLEKARQSGLSLAPAPGLHTGSRSPEHSGLGDAMEEVVPFDTTATDAAPAPDGGHSAGGQPASMPEEANAMAQALLSQLQSLDHKTDKVDQEGKVDPEDKGDGAARTEPVLQEV